MAGRPAAARLRARAVLWGALLLTAAIAAAACSSDAGPEDTATDAGLSLPVRALDARSLDGTGNHLDDPTLGAVGSTYRRTAPARFADGTDEPLAHPAERRISNRVFDDLGRNIHSARGVTHWGYAWGQFILHDLTFGKPGTEAAPIAFDAADPLERFHNDLGAIDFTRSFAGPPDAHGARTHVNELSSYLDGSVLYGTTPEQLDWLRAGPLDGDPTNNSPYLLNDGLWLPTAADRPGTEPPAMELTGRLRGAPDTAFIAGDARANENWPLTSLHTLWVREHNRIVAALPDDLFDEARFQIARRLVVAEIQWITFHEYLPAIGVELEEYAGYDASVDPTITDEFATAAFRMHSQVHGELRLTDTYGGLSAEAVDALRAVGIRPQQGTDGTEVFVPLDVAFSNPTLLREVGVDAILQALSWDVGYANDDTIDDALRSVLFQVPAEGVDPATCTGATVAPDCFTGVIDLAAIDIARGYDHGLPSYNELRVAYGLEPVTSFAELTGEATDELPEGMTIDDPAIMAITAEYDRNGQAIVDAPARTTSVTRIERASTTAARLRALYQDVDAIDAFTGMQAERRHADSELGELQHAIWSRQFAAIRDGDRWWGEGDALLDEIVATYGIDYRRTLDEVVRDDARTLLEVPPRLFGR